MSVLGLSFLIVIFFRIPFFVQGIPDGDIVNNIMAGGASILIVAIAIPRVKSDRRAVVFFALLLMFKLSVAPISFTAGGSVGEALKYYATVLLQVAYCLLIYICIKSDDGVWITSLVLVCWVVVLLNLYTLIAYPQGLYHVGESLFEASFRNWFLGYDNVHAEFFVYASMISMLASYRKTGRPISFSSVAMYVICLVSTLVVQALTSMFAMLILGIYIVIRSRTDNVSMLNIRSYLVAFFAVFFFLVLFAVGSTSMSTEGVQPASEFFGKDATLSNRTVLWTNAINWFIQSPLVGNGIEPANVLEMKIGHVSGPHNELINILYSGGIIHFVIFCIFFYVSVKPIWVNRGLVPAQIISIAIFCMLVLQLMRGCSEVYWLSMYLMAYFVLDIEKISKKQEGICRATE